MGNDKNQKSFCAKCRKKFTNAGNHLFLENTMFLGQKLRDKRQIQSEDLFLKSTMFLGRKLRNLREKFFCNFEKKIFKEKPESPFFQKSKKKSFFFGLHTRILNNLFFISKKL